MNTLSQIGDIRKYIYISPLPIPNLLSILMSLKDRIAAVVYIKRSRTPPPPISEILRSTKIITIGASKKLISHKNRTNKKLICNLRELHPKNISEGRLSKALWSSRQNLKRFGPAKFKNKKKNKPSQKKRALKGVRLVQALLNP